MADTPTGVKIIFHWCVVSCERGFDVKKKLIICLVTFVIALSFAIPVAAVDVVVSEPTGTIMVEKIEPLSEHTVIYFRFYNDMLQYRIWGMISGRWLTDWADFGPPL
jgi:hypothetical protein